MQWHTETIPELGFPIIDAHAHPYFNRDQPGTGPADYDGYAAELMKRGIGVFCGTCNIRNDGSDPDVVRKENAVVLEWKAHFGEHFYPGVNIHPAYPDASIAAVEEFHRRGFRWVGEIAYYVQGYTNYATPELAKILDVVQSLGMVLNCHPSSTFEDLDQLLSNFPKLDVVVAHPGGVKGGVPAAYELGRKHPNLCFDLSGSGLCRWHMLRHGIDLLGKERFLFGTDYPVINPGMYVQGALFEPLTAAERRAVFRDNFLRLTGQL